MKDIFNKDIEIGHIVCVKYVWSTYVGVVRPEGLHINELAKRHWTGVAYHGIDIKNTHQILGHVDFNHKDFNKGVYDWAFSEDETITCPVTVYLYKTKDEIRKLKIESLYDNSRP